MQGVRVLKEDRPSRSRPDLNTGHKGKLVASVLAGAWRRSPPPLSISPTTLAEITPLLLRAGAASLGWWRVRNSDLRNCAAALELQQAYRLYTLRARLHERRIVPAIALLSCAGVEPLLAKGWAAARLYPEHSLRPYGDIDLWVRARQHATAVEALSSPAAQRFQVDLHQEFRLLEYLDRSWDELYERSQLLPLGTVEVRIPGPEDHLRLLCLHMFRHGVLRPLWLCDIAAALEGRSEDFDWEYCLSGDPRRSDWFVCAIGLAHQLLGARLDGIPVARRARHLPRWLLPAVLRQWGSSEHYMNSPSMAFCLRHPARALRALRLRWPNPILATVGVGGPFNELPRLPFQLAECVSRTARFMARAMAMAMADRKLLRRRATAPIVAART